jgi:hypothetical protein
LSDLIGMTRAQHLSLVCIGLLAVVLAGLAARSAYLRSQQPKYEGRTAKEWVEFYSRQATSAHPYQVPEKEAEVVFRSLGPEAQSYLIQEFLLGTRPSRNRTNLYTLSDKLPSALRLRLLRDPRIRFAVIGEAVRLSRPDWPVFAPHIEAVMQEGDTNRILAALSILGRVGQGATNAVPYLVAGLTDTHWLPQAMAQQSLEHLGTNAAGALPQLLPALTNGTWNPRHLRIIGNLGPMAREALPSLETLFRQSTNPQHTRDVAVALLQIDPSHTEALNHLEQLLTSDDPAQQRLAERLRLWFRHQQPNPAFARLIRLQMFQSKDWQGPVGQLLRHDPEDALQIIRAQLAQGRNVHGWLFLLLQHDPADPVALDYLAGKIRNPFFPRDNLRHNWVYLLHHCHPDTPGVAALLDHALSAAPDDPMMRKTVANARREIELNDQLRKLRAKDDRQSP